MVLNFVLVVIDHAASDEDKRIENKPPLSYDPSVEWSDLGDSFRRNAEVGTNVKVSFMERTKTKFFVKLQTKTK